MTYLLDTHVLIYLGCAYEDNLTQKVIEIFKNQESKLAVSRISFWEMAIKINIGKLEIPIGLKKIIDITKMTGIEIIPMRDSHILYYQSLEVHKMHKDPFDRYIISTALCESMPVISKDSKFDLYTDVIRIWH